MTDSQINRSAENNPDLQDNVVPDHEADTNEANIAPPSNNNPSFEEVSWVRRRFWSHGYIDSFI